MAITTRSRFALENLRAPIAEALGVSDVRLGDIGDRIPGASFISLREISAVELGIPGRTQISDDQEEIRLHVELVVSVQAYGPGAMHVLRALAAWLGSSPGMLTLGVLGTSCPRVTLPRNLSQSVPGGWEERAVMTVTLSHDDCYVVSLPTIKILPVGIATATGNHNFDIER